MGKNWNISSEIWARQRCLLSPLLFNRVLEVNRQEKKRHQSEGKQYTLSVCKWHDDTYMQNLNRTTYKHLPPPQHKEPWARWTKLMHHTSWLCYYKFIAITTVWCWKKTDMETQWNRIENSEIKLCIYCQLDLPQWGKWIELSTNGRKIGSLHAKKETGPNFIPYAYIYLKMD